MPPKKTASKGKESTTTTTIAKKPQKDSHPQGKKPSPKTTKDNEKSTPQPKTKKKKTKPAPSKKSELMESLSRDIVTGKVMLFDFDVFASYLNSISQGRKIRKSFRNYVLITFNCLMWEIIDNFVNSTKQNQKAQNEAAGENGSEFYPPVHFTIHNKMVEVVSSYFGIDMDSLFIQNGSFGFYFEEKNLPPELQSEINAMKIEAPDIMEKIQEATRLIRKENVGVGQKFVQQKMLDLPPIRVDEPEEMDLDEDDTQGKKKPKNNTSTKEVTEKNKKQQAAPTDDNNIDDDDNNESPETNGDRDSTPVPPTKRQESTKKQSKKPARPNRNQPKKKNNEEASDDSDKHWS